MNTRTACPRPVTPATPAAPAARAAPVAAALLATLLALTGPPAGAHDLRIEPQAGGWALRFGHAGDERPVDTTRLRGLVAVDARGRPLAVQPEPGDGGTALHVDGAEPAVLAAWLDNGWWSRVAEGTRAQNVPMDRLPAAVSGVHALKYGKTVVRWGEIATRPQGHRLEIVPLQPKAPRAGAPLQVQVLHEGRPLAGARLSRGEDDAQPLSTDAAGRATLQPVAGWQTLLASHRVPLVGDPRGQAVALSATLVFAAR